MLIWQAARVRAFLLPIACGFFACGGGPDSSTAGPGTKPGDKKPERPVLVEVAEVRRGSMSDVWKFLGDVRPVHRAAFSAGASGTVTRVLVDIGDRVSKGKLLVEVDPKLAEARLESAKAAVARGAESLAQARRESERLAGLDDRSVPAIDLERAKSRVRQMEAEQAGLDSALASAEAELALHRVTAAFDGVVSRRSAQLGAWVRPGDPVVEVVSSERVEVFVDASKDLVSRIRVGQKAKLTTGGEAEVVGIVPALDPSTRTSLVRLTPTSGTKLLPGDVISVEFAVDLSGEGVLVPEDALVVTPSETRVVRLKGDIAETVRVRVLARADDGALVVGEGLSENDRVVTRGNERIRPGQVVQISGGGS